MADRNPIEFSGKVLDQRNTLTGPDDAGKGTYPELPKNVAIQQTKNKNVK